MQKAAVGKAIGVEINRSLKLAIDILLGSVVPILVLSYLSGPMGPVPAYLLARRWM